MLSPAKPGYYDHLDFNSPMTSATAANLIGRLAAAEPTTIVDIGCGWGELLLRLLAALPNAAGEGFDSDNALIARATANAAQRDMAGRVTFNAAEVGEPTTGDLVLCVGSDHIFGTPTDAFNKLGSWVRPGGSLLFGTGFWEQPPSDDLLAFFGELPTLPEVVAQATGAGWRVRDLRTASLDDWDEFEFGFAADWELAAKNADTVEETTEARRIFDTYIADYLLRRGVLGFAYLTLGRLA